MRSVHIRLASHALCRVSWAGERRPENAKTLTSILAGEHGPRRDAAVANAALGIYVAGKASTLIEARERAEEAIDSSLAMKSWNNCGSIQIGHELSDEHP